jgi:tellurite resistance protein TerC
MYFALAEMMERFHYLHYGLSVVLIFIGLKMIGSHYIEVPTEWALGIVLLVLGTSIVVSLAKPQKKLTH